MSKDFLESKQTEISTIDVNLVCNYWKDDYLIASWITNSEEEYYFNIQDGNKNVISKIRISKEQAEEIISRLNLKKVKDYVLKTFCRYFTENYIKKEIERINIKKNKLEDELNDIIKELYKYERSL